MTFQSYRVNGCSQCPQIMMITGTLYLYTFPVQQKAIIMSKLYGPKTKRHFISINLLLSVIHLHPSQITVSSLQTSAFGRKDSQRDTIVYRTICRKIQLHWTTRSHFLSGLFVHIQLVHRHGIMSLYRCRQMILYLNMYQRFRFRVRNRRSSYKNAPMLHVYLRSLYQTYMPIDSCTGIPA